MSVSVFSSFYFFFFLISWRLITLQYCSGFCHTLTWISHGFPCIPHPDPPSHIPLHPIPLGLRSAPGPLSHLLLLFLMQFFIFLSFFFFFFFYCWILNLLIYVGHTVCKSFLSVCNLAFHPLNKVVCRANILNVPDIYFVNFLMVCGFLLSFRSWRFSLLFFSKNPIALCFIFNSMIHFVLICIIWLL